MTVKDIFDMRKQGRIEEAYEAIRPMYAVHKGRYTTLCMFWTASDVFKLRMEQGRIEEASKILEALKRMLPRVEEVNRQLDSEYAAPAKTDEKLPWEYEENSGSSSSAFGFIQYATRRLNKESSSCETSDTIEKSPGINNPELDQSTEDKNIQDSQNPCSLDNTNVSEHLQPKSDDHSGHLTVSLEDGIIRPLEGVNASQRIVLACLVAHPGYSVLQISAATGLPAKNIEHNITVLVDRGLIEYRGSKIIGGYYPL